jgi:putative transposase
MMDNDARWQTWRRKRNRLHGETYRGFGTFAVTVTTWQRQRVFSDAAQVQRTCEMLERAARTTGFTLLAYCFMPDHLHLLVEGSRDSDLAHFMKSFKQASSFEHKRRVGQPLWQRSYYDHVLRTEDEIGRAVDYILSNPVRAGLVDDAAAYPFLGGVVLRGTAVAT